MLVKQAENTDFIGNLINSWIIMFIMTYTWFPVWYGISIDMLLAFFGTPGFSASIVVPSGMWPSLVTGHEAFFN